MHARGLLIRGAGLVVLSLSVFYGCGGLNEPDVFTDAELHANPDGSLCGNGKVDPGEDCDSTNLNGRTCASMTMTSSRAGFVLCGKDCKFDLSHCAGLGDSGPGAGGNNGTGGNGSGGLFGSGGSGFGGVVGSGGVVGAAGRFGAGGAVTGTGGAVGAAGAGGVDVQCTSDAACSNNRVCCGTQTGGQLTSISCQRNCPGASLPVACSTAADCGNGQVCCGTLNGAGSAYTSIGCAATCGQGGGNERVLCTTSAECGQGTTCRASTLLPSGFLVCR